MKLGLVSLGCPKNLVDSEVMLGIIDACQIEIVNDPAEAEIIIVNTCGFIESAKQESIETILSMAEYKKTGKCRYLVVTGCLAQRYAEDLFRDMPEVDAIVGTNVYRDIALVLEKVLAGQRLIHMTAADWEAKQKASAAGEAQAGREGDTALSLPPNKTEPVAAGIEEQRRTALADPRFLTTAPYTAYLKIAEGCDNFCSFCAIPLIRGRYISKPYEQILAEARSLAAQGVKELVVVAQDTTRYGSDLYGKLRLAELLKDLNDLPGIKWIRVLPLQHASDRLLKAMNRHDRLEHTRTLLAELRRRIPDIVIRTTFIVGFPGETAEDFAILKQFVAEQRFENAGVFQYSREENTVAARLADQVPPEVMQERYDELMSIQAGISEELHKELEGRELEVVIEGYAAEESADLAVARSYREAPDIDGNIFVENAPGLHPGDFIKVRVDQGFAYEVVANRVE